MVINIVVIGMVPVQVSILKDVNSTKRIVRIVQLSFICTFLCLENFFMSLSLKSLSIHWSRIVSTVAIWLWALAFTSFRSFMSIEKMTLSCGDLCCYICTWSYRSQLHSFMLFSTNQPIGSIMSHHRKWRWP